MVVEGGREEEAGGKKGEDWRRGKEGGEKGRPEWRKGEGRGWRVECPGCKDRQDGSSWEAAAALSRS